MNKHTDFPRYNEVAANIALFSELETAFREKETFLNNILSSIQDGICVIDHAFNILLANEQIHQWFPDDVPVKGKKCYQVFRNRESKCPNCQCLDTMKSGKSCSVEFPLAQADNQPSKWLLYTSFPFKNFQTGRITGVVLHIRDITREKLNRLASARAHQQLRAVFDAIPGTVSVMDNKCVVVSLNDNLHRLKPEFSTSRAIGNRYCDLFKGMPPCDQCRIGKIIANGQTITRVSSEEEEALTGKAMKFYLSPIRDQHGTIRGVVEVVMDVSDLKQAREELVMAKEAAESANQAKSLFLANMSHEIRTPMHAVLGFTELLDATINNPQQKSYIESIKTSAKNLLTLINDLLDLSKIDAGKLQLHYEPVNPHTIFQEIRSIFSLRISQKRLELILDISRDIPELLMIDEVRLRQVLFNLIGNAIKFTEKGWIRVSADVSHWDRIHHTVDLMIRVEDTGVGIPADSQQKIFETFEQGDGMTTRKFGGTGLGLTITKRLVEMMNGTISVESRENQGTTFTIHLHQLAVGGGIHFQKPTPIIDVDAIRFSPATVLSVDDASINRMLIHEFLSETGLHVMEAEDGQEAIIVAEQYHPDIILMDIRMPGMDGIEAARRIRENSALKDIPIIALSASVFRKTSDPEILRVFDDYLTKPVGQPELLMTLARYLSHEFIDSNQCNGNEIQLETSCIDSEIAVIRRQPNILYTLEYLLENEWKDLHGKGNFNLIHTFGRRMEAFGKRYYLKSIETFGKDLIQCADQFDVERIEALLTWFPEIIANYKTGIRNE